MKIVVFSDGTGNSSAKLFRTNVWRLYEALDLGDRPNRSPTTTTASAPPPSGPLALLGGAFGWGLKRNVRDIYRFICRNAPTRQASRSRLRVQPWRVHHSRPAWLDALQGLVPYNGDERELEAMGDLGVSRIPGKGPAGRPHRQDVPVDSRHRPRSFERLRRGPAYDAAQQPGRCRVAFAGCGTRWPPTDFRSSR